MFVAGVLGCALRRPAHLEGSDQRPGLAPPYLTRDLLAVTELGHGVRLEEVRDAGGVTRAPVERRRQRADVVPGRPSVAHRDRFRLRQEIGTRQGSILGAPGLGQLLQRRAPCLRLGGDLRVARTDEIGQRGDTPRQAATARRRARSGRQRGRRREVERNDAHEGERRADGKGASHRSSHRHGDR